MSGEGAATGALSLVLVNTPPSDADRIARALVESRLAACVNVIPAVKSFYHWEGKLEEATESTLLIKTQKALLPALVQAVKSIHPHALPEVVAFEIDASVGNGEYLAWLRAETHSG